MSKPKKPRRGRPPVPMAEQRRNKLSVRVRDDLFEWLEKCAKAAGLTLSEFCESLLQVAFEKGQRGEGYDEFIRLEIDRLQEEVRRERKVMEEVKRLLARQEQSR